MVLLGVVFSVLGHVRLVVEVRVRPGRNVIVMVCTAIQIAVIIIREVILGPVAVISLQRHV